MTQCLVESWCKVSPRKGVLEDEGALGAELPECVDVDEVVLAAEYSSGDAEAHEELLAADAWASRSLLSKSR